MAELEVSVVPCEEYDPGAVRRALEKAIEEIGGLDWVKPNMRVALKANLVTAMRPETAAVTHPVVCAEVTRMLTERGAQVILGDSPGGPWGGGYLAGVYAAAGMKLVEEAGGMLNRDFSVAKVEAPESKTAHAFDATGWLLKCDAIVDICKLKSHGLTGLSGAVKNLFGTVPGLVKSEYHYLYPRHEDFASMLVDLAEYWKPVLCICDAVEAMEGNGPTQGTVRQVGVIAASKSPHKLDLALAGIIHLQGAEVPTLKEAMDRGFVPESYEAMRAPDLAPFRVEDFETVGRSPGLLLRSGHNSFLRRTAAAAVKKLLQPRPKLRKGCVGCGKCAERCPAHAIEMRGGKPVIDRRTCIRCFCCQEFCVTGAMKAERSVVAKLFITGRRT